MVSLSSVSSSLVTRPSGPPVSTRPTSGSPEAAPAREPDRVEFTGAAIEPVEPVERGQAGAELSESERKQVEELKARDQEVRTHEQAHVAAAGPYFRGGPNYSYQRGPDGNRYAVGGSVQIDSSPVPGDPQATIAKAQVVRRAALAPAEPSNTDRNVAAAASRMEAEAQRELAQERASGNDSTVEGADDTERTEPGAVERQNDATGTERTTGDAERTDEGVPVNERGETSGGALDVFA